MRFIGIDPAASKGIALVSIGEHTPSVVIHHVSPVFPEKGTQRLVRIRQWVRANVAPGSVCVAVESQYLGSVLPAIGHVCAEAAQAAAPGAVVLELKPTEWRKALTGSGRMSKDEAMDLAETWGLPRQDDIAEALCLALVARSKWLAAAA